MVLKQPAAHSEPPVCKTEKIVLCCGGLPGSEAARMRRVKFINEADDRRSNR